MIATFAPAVPRVRACAASACARRLRAAPSRDASPAHLRRHPHHLRRHVTRMHHATMAAVFALVFLPALAAAGFMFKVVQGDLSFATAMAGMIFIALAGGTFFGLFRMARKWENEPTT
jgi:cytochrome c biogenesis protein CcdA